LHNSSDETGTLVINLIDKSEAEISQNRPKYISGKYVAAIYEQVRDSIH
jgi:hypothetical protein